MTVLVYGSIPNTKVIIQGLIIGGDDALYDILTINENFRRQE